MQDVWQTLLQNNSFSTEKDGYSIYFSTQLALIMKTKLSFVISTLVLIVICTACGENNKPAEQTEAIHEEELTNNSWANEKLKGHVKTMTQRIYYDTRDVNGVRQPADTANYLISISSYNPEGFITLQETYEVVNSNKQLSYVEEYIYKEELEKIIQKDKNGNITSTANVVNIDNKQVLTQRDNEGKVTMKVINVFDKSYARDTVETIMYNNRHEPDMAIARKYVYNNEGLMEKDIMMPKENGQLTDIENYAFTKYSIQSKDEHGNPVEYSLSLNMPTGEEQHIVRVCSYEYY